jgi:hypothetical protein
VDGAGADIVCIAALPPGGLTHARYLCKRLRARFPQRSIILLRPASASDGEVTECATRVTTLVAARAEIEGVAPSPSAHDADDGSAREDAA